MKSIKSRIVVLAVVAVLLSITTLALVVWIQRGTLQTQVSETLNKNAQSAASSVARDVYVTCVAQQESLLSQMAACLNVTRYVIAQTGGIRTGEPLVKWAAVNQYTKTPTSVELPQLMVGETAIPPNTDPAVTTPIVDQVKALAGGTCTIFQRINDAGDMLRVATNVMKTDGNRAVGTFIPATNPDGVPNPVVSTLLAGETYLGRAFVVDGWYITGYEPFRGPDGEVMGAIYFGLALSAIESVRTGVASMVVGETGHVYVVGGSDPQAGELIVARDTERVGSQLLSDGNGGDYEFIAEAIAAAKAAAPGESTGITYESTGGTGTHYLGVTYFAPWDWVIVADVPASDFNAAQAQVQSALGRMVLYVLCIGAVLAIIVSAFAYIATGRLLRPLRAILANLEGLTSGNGDLTVRLPVTSQDEVGVIAASLNHFIEFLQGIVRNVTANSVTVRSGAASLNRGAADMAAGNEALAQKSAATSAAVHDVAVNVREVAGAVDSMNATTSMVATASEEVTANLNNVGAAVEQVSANMSTVSDASEQMDSDVTQVAAAIEELSASLAEVSAQSNRASDVASAAGRKAKETTDTVGRLGTAANEIGSVVDMISGIAAQTNLLALNATIEAASAGEAGKGFAVVANEVKELAKRTSAATEEIRKKVGEMQDNTTESVDAIAGIVATIQEMSELSVAIARAVAEQTATTSEVSQSIGSTARNVENVARSIREASLGTNDVSRHVQEAIQGANEIARSIADISSNADTIARNAASAAAGISETESNVHEMDRLVRTARADAANIAGTGAALGNLTEELDRVVSQFKAGERRYDLGAAKVAHLLMQIRLRALIDGVIDVEAAGVSTMGESAFGQWLQTQKGGPLASHPAFGEVLQQYEETHRIAGEIAGAHARGDSDGANRAMDTFQQATNELFAAMDQLYAA